MAISTGLGLAIAGGAALVGGVASGIMSSNASEEAAETQAQTASETTAVAQAQWNRYLTKFAPLENKMVEEVSKPVEQQPGYLGSMGQLERGYANTGASLRKTMAGRYPSGGGLEMLPQSTLALSKPLARAGVYNQQNQQLMANRLNVANLGKGLPTTAMAGYGSAGGTYGNIANTNAQAAASGWGSLGNIGSNVMQYYMLNQMLNKPGYSPVTSDWSNYYSPVQ